MGFVRSFAVGRELPHPTVRQTVATEYLRYQEQMWHGFGFGSWSF